MVAPLLTPRTLSSIAAITARLRPDRCLVVRGGDVVASWDCRLEAQRSGPGSPDPADASAGEETVRRIALNPRATVRPGDAIVRRGESWDVGDAPSDSYLDGIERYAVVTRPRTATPAVWMVLSRWDDTAEARVTLPAQLVHLVYADRAARGAATEAGRATFAEGTLIEGTEPGGVLGDLDVRGGDRFNNGGRRHRITAVLSAAGQRVEANFVADTEAA